MVLLRSDGVLFSCTVVYSMASSYRTGSPRQETKERTELLEGGIVKLLEKGSIRLVSVPWLLAQPASFKMPRRQELEREPGALVDCTEAVRLLRARKVAVLSYRWLEASHPDPNGFHFTAVKASSLRRARAAPPPSFGIVRCETPFPEVPL